MSPVSLGTRLHKPGILALPVARLLPFFSLWTMHVWIYWFNTTTVNPAPASAPWPITIYGVMTALLLGVAFRYRARPSTGTEGRLDLPMTILMCATTLSTLAAGLLASTSVAWRIANVATAGICMGWGYLRWSILFTDLGIRDAVACLFSSYVLGSSIKVAFDVAPPILGCLLAFALPIISTASLHQVTAHAWAQPEERRGTIVYQQGGYGSLARIAACVLVFCFVYKIAPNVAQGGPNDPLIAGRLLGHAVEVAFALGALAWVFRLNRSLDFPQLWRFVFLFLATAIAAECLGLNPIVADLCNSVTSSLVVMLLWLLLSDVAHHSTAHPYAVFGLGWSLYVGGRYLGHVVEHTLGIAAAPLALGVILLWALGVVMAFCLEARDPDVSRIFADLRNKVDPEEFATIDERSEQLAREYALTDRETDVLKLLAKGRSKVYIAETLYISENTVRGHARRLYAKLDVHTRDELQALLGL